VRCELPILELVKKREVEEILSEVGMHDVAPRSWRQSAQDELHQLRTPKSRFECRRRGKSQRSRTRPWSVRPRPERGHPMG
jgi:hypothetical protein